MNLIELSEKEVVFKYDENAVMKTNLKLKNVSRKMVAFKVKKIEFGLLT